MAKTTVLTSRQWVVLKYFLDLKWGRLISAILGFAPQRWIKRSQVCLATMWILSFLPYTKIFKKTLIKKGQEWTFDIFFYGRKEKEMNDFSIYSICFPISFNLNPSELAQINIYWVHPLEATDCIKYHFTNLPLGRS